MLVIQNIWWVLVLMGVMILIHELGHFWAARFFDVRVEAFSFGFGPRLFGFRRGETDYRFSAILFGGYVKMTGEQPGEEVSDPRAFAAKPRWQRLIIAAAGPAMNILLAIGLLTGLYMFRYPKVANADAPATIGYIQKDSPAAAAGLREGDVIVRINDISDPRWEDVLVTEVASARKPITITYERDGQRHYTTVTPILDEETGVGTSGWEEQNVVQIAGILPGMDAEIKGLQAGDILIAVNGQRVRSMSKLHEMVRRSNGQPVVIDYKRGSEMRQVSVTPKFSQAENRWMIGVQLERPVEITQLAFPAALREAVRQNVRGATLIFSFLQGLVERRMSPKSMEGPIGIARLSGAAAREGASSFVLLMATVSLNLAIFNLLPIPILDGGLILMLLIEMVMRRDLSLNFKEAVFKVGMVFLMVVMVFVLFNDIRKLLPG